MDEDQTKLLEEQLAKIPKREDTLTESIKTLNALIEEMDRDRSVNFQTDCKPSAKHENTVQSPTPDSSARKDADLSAAQSAEMVVSKIEKTAVSLDSTTQSAERSAPKKPKKAKTKKSAKKRHLSDKNQKIGTEKGKNSEKLVSDKKEKISEKDKSAKSVAVKKSADEKEGAGQRLSLKDKFLRLLMWVAASDFY